MSKLISINALFLIKGKNILGVNPPVTDFAFFDLWSKPMGFLYLLEKMRELGNHAEFIDCIHEGAVGAKTFGREKIGSVEISKPSVYAGIRRNYHRFGMSEEAFRRRLREVNKPDCVFLTSVMTYWYPGVRWAINVIKSELPNVPIYLGGIYARLCPEHAGTLGADMLATENWMPDVPLPAMDLYDRLPYGVTMTSFGCPLRCKYCASHVLWPEYRRRPTAEVLEEIGFQARLGARDFAFYDDALLLEKEKYFYPLCEELTRRYGEALSFHTPNGLHVRQIDEKCASVLRKTNFRTIRLSLESIDPRIAGDSSGKVARGEYAAAVKNLRTAGYTRNDCETYILLGLPGQSVTSVKDTIRFVQDNGGKPKLAEFSPIPGTPSFEEAAVVMPELRAEPLLQNNSVYSSWLSHEISPETLQELKDLARQQI